MNENITEDQKFQEKYSHIYTILKSYELRFQNLSINGFWIIFVLMQMFIFLWIAIIIYWLIPRMIENSWIIDVRYFLLLFFIPHFLTIWVLVVKWKEKWQQIIKYYLEKYISFLQSFFTMVNIGKLPGKFLDENEKIYKNFQKNNELENYKIIAKILSNIKIASYYSKFSFLFQENTKQDFWKFILEELRFLEFILWEIYQKYSILHETAIQDLEKVKNENIDNINILAIELQQKRLLKQKELFETFK